MTLARHLWDDVRLLLQVLDETVSESTGSQGLALVRQVREAALALRDQRLPGGRDAFASEIGRLELPKLELLARTSTQLFHLLNAAEEQQRIRSLRLKDRPNEPPAGSIAAACLELRKNGVELASVHGVLERLLIMPVLTAHPSEPKRRTIVDHLSAVSRALDTLDDPRLGARDGAQTLNSLRESVLALTCTEELRGERPTVLDEVRAGLDVFERSLLEVTPRIYRELEDALAAAWPAEPFRVGSFLRWGSWIGGDRDGNPNVTAEVTRAVFERQRALAIRRHLEDSTALGRELSLSRELSGIASEPLEASLVADRVRLPEVAARARKHRALEPLREKITYIQSRLRGALRRDERGYATAIEYRDDLALLEGALAAGGLARLARGRLRDAVRRAEVFAFHLASLDIRQHSEVHAAAVGDILGSGGVDRYQQLPERRRVELLAELLDRADIGAPRDRSGYSPETRELLATFDVVGRARRDLGPEACDRWIASFTRGTSDLLEVLLLARAARLGPDEIRPIPLFEQIEDIERAAQIAEESLSIGPLRLALGGELEVMLGYSDGGKQIGYVASSVALRGAQVELAGLAQREKVTLTIFHGRGGAVGRGGGPANRAIRAQPRRALAGRFRVTEQGETVATRYGRAEIARRDLEQMVNAVLLGSVEPARPRLQQDAELREAALGEAARAARAAYERLLEDRERLTRYVLQATPIEEIAEMRIASRPASRRPGLAFEDLRAIPWVFSWNQSRHGMPGWFGLGTALDKIVDLQGVDQIRRMYRDFPFFRALVDNAQLALVRADMDVAAHYARLADPDVRSVFDQIRDEHARTVARVLEVTGSPELLSDWPTLLETARARNPHVDVLSHTQIELLRRLRVARQENQDVDRIRSALATTISGIAAGLQTAG